MRVLAGFLVLCLTSLSGCGWWAKNGGKAEDIIVDCGKEAIKTEVAHLLPAILAILTGNAPDWQAQLVALESVGKDAVLCAVAEAQTKFVMEHATAGPDSPVAKASQYIGNKQYKAAP